jgi:hypothetical protein
MAAAQFVDLMNAVMAMCAKEFEPQFEPADMALDLADKRFCGI